MFQFSSNSKTLTAIELMLRNRAVVTNTHWPSCMGNRVWLSRASGQTPSNWGAGATAGKAYGAWNTRGLWAAPGRKLNCRVSGSCQEGAPSFSLAYSLSSTLLHTFLCLLSVFISFGLLPDLSLCSLSHCYAGISSPADNMFILDASVPGKSWSCVPWSPCSLAIYCFLSSL